MRLSKNCTFLAGSTQDTGAFNDFFYKNLTFSSGPGTDHLKACMSPRTKDAHFPKQKFRWEAVTCCPTAIGDERPKTELSMTGHENCKLCSCASMCTTNAHSLLKAISVKFPQTCTLTLFVCMYGNFSTFGGFRNARGESDLRLEKLQVANKRKPVIYDAVWLQHLGISSTAKAFASDLAHDPLAMPAPCQFQLGRK